MRAASTLIAIAAALWLASPSAHALGFGRVTNATQLGQPLNFEAAVRLDSDETLARECVSAEVLAGENKLAAGQVRVTLEGAADSLDRRVRVTTSVDGFGAAWRNVLDRFFARYQAAASIEINDFGATPGTVMLRLEQAAEASRAAGSRR